MKRSLNNKMTSQMSQNSSEKTKEKKVLEDDHKWLRTIIQTIPDLVWLKDTNGTYLMCNPKFEDFFGYKESEIIGKTDFDFVSNELALFFRQKDKEALEASKPSTNTEWITSSNDGHRELVETIKTPMYSAEGKIIGILGIARDITARSIAENDLRKFMLGIENSSDAIFVTDINGTIDFINPAFEKTYGFSGTEALGKTPRILKSGLIPSESYKHLWDTLLAGEPVIGELKNKTKDGRIIDIEASNNPIIDEKGIIVGFISINRDITERKQALAELILAKEKAEQSDKLKSAFLANMSHEIRTPLNGILGFSALIRDRSTTPAELDEYFKMMETSGNDLINLIDDILDISRIEANQIEINLRETPVAQFAEEVFRTFKLSLYSENPDNPVIPLFVVPPGKADYVLSTDPLRLKQILLNILNNSIKFTTEGSIEFCYSPNEAKTRMVFYIKDTGIGIAKDQQEKIFERFTKVADIKTKRYRGTGLGLSIALKFTQLLNGDICVESELNVGSVFYLSFPLSKVLSPVAVPEQKPKDESLTFLSGKVILIAEDVEYNYRYLNIVLSKNQDVKIIWAKTGIEAVDFCKKNPEISIVLMDIQLPEMNGLDAVRLIKSENRNLPVIAQTAYATPIDIEGCFNAGCDDVLIKPINRITLLQLLKKYIT
jgi:PAS domain S-box-containing protein